MQKGYVQIYTGNGKGKTTASIGLAVRAAGRGLRVQIVQFLKGIDTGEISILKNIKGISIKRVAESTKFFWNMNDDEKSDSCSRASQGIGEVLGQLRNNEIDLLILDESLGALETGIITTHQIESILNARPEGVEIVLTGRNAPKELIEKAHLVTEMVPIKHYFDEGVNARKGIEF